MPVSETKKGIKPMFAGGMTMPPFDPNDPNLQFPQMPPEEMDPTAAPPLPRPPMELSRFDAPPPDMGGGSGSGMPEMPNVEAPPPPMDAIGRDPRFRQLAVQQKMNQDQAQAPPPMGGLKNQGAAQQQAIDYAQRILMDPNHPGQFKKPSVLQDVLGAVAPRVNWHPNLTREYQNYELLKSRADEERKMQQAQANEQIKEDTLATNKETRLAAQASRRPAQTIADRIKEAQSAVGTDGQPLYSPDEIKMIGAGWKPPAEKTEKTPALHNVPPGSVALDGTGKPVYTNPAIEKEPKPDRETEMQWIADANNPDLTISGPAKQKLERLTGQRASVARAGAQARSDVTKEAGSPIEMGDPRFKVAQDLAYGKLTMPQFRTLYAYSRDSGAKLAIYQKASELNPNFNPASFEMGFSLAKNPRVQQQLAALDNVKQAVPDLMAASDAASRTGVPLLNGAILKGGVALGGKKYSNFASARTAFADELSGALGFGSATDMSRQMGYDMTNPALSPDAFRSGIQDIVIPFLERKRGTMLNQMGVYGQPGMNPAAPQEPAAAPATGTSPQGGQPAATGTIRVRNKATGQTGSLPAANFDPAKYDKL